MRSRGRSGHCLLVLACVVLAARSPEVRADDAESAGVLVLHTQSRETFGQLRFDKGLRAALREGFRGSVEIYGESLENTRFP